MPNIVNGFRVDTLSINDQVALTGGTADPRSVDQGSITIMPQGTLYVSTTGDIYQKQSTGNLNWGKLVSEDFATGNVGIGTTSPGSKLHVEGDIKSNNPGSTTGTVLLSGPNGLPGIVFTSNNPENYRADIRRVSDRLAIAVQNTTGIPTERLAIMNSGNVGIGTTSPVTSLHVVTSTSGVFPVFVNNAALVIQKNAIGADCALSIIGSNTARSIINFGDDNSENIGRIEYSHTLNMLKFVTATAERMRIDSSGNVGIGTTAPATPSHVKQGSTTAAIPVETLEQLDTNEPFIEVLGTENATTGSVLTGKTAHGGTQKFIKCKINGVVGYLQWSTVPA